MSSNYSVGSRNLDESSILSEKSEASTRNVNSHEAPMSNFWKRVKVEKDYNKMDEKERNMSNRRGIMSKNESHDPFESLIDM